MANKSFEKLKTIKEGKEVWLGRDMQHALGYSRWEKFRKVVNSVFNEIEFETGDFRQAGKFYLEPTKTKPRENAELTRLACYKIAMRGETEACNQARTYFATQTRKQELSTNNKHLALPTDVELAKMVIKAHEEKERLQLEVEEQKAKLDFQDEIIEGITKDVPIKTLRANLNQIIRRNGEGFYKTRWMYLYKEFKYRYHVDIETRSENLGINKLDYAEEYGYLRPLYELAMELFIRDPQYQLQ